MLRLLAQQVTRLPLVQLRNVNSAASGNNRIFSPISAVYRNYSNALTFNSAILSNASQLTTKNLLAAPPNSICSKSLLENAPQLQQQSVRSVTKFSLVKGKRKSVKAVLKRFKRLHWGCWIRTHCGRHKKMFKKSAALKRRLRQHVFTNATQSWLLDKMVTNFWRRPKYYINDPYEPYHHRNEYFATKKPTFKV